MPTDDSEDLMSVVTKSNTLIWTKSHRWWHSNSQRGIYNLGLQWLKHSDSIWVCAIHGSWGDVWSVDRFGLKMAPCTNSWHRAGSYENRGTHVGVCVLIPCGAQNHWWLKYFLTEKSMPLWCWYGQLRLYSVHFLSCRKTYHMQTSTGWESRALCTRCTVIFLTWLSGASILHNSLSCSSMLQTFSANIICLFFDFISSVEKGLSGVSS